MSKKKRRLERAQANAAAAADASLSPGTTGLCRAKHCLQTDVLCSAGYCRRCCYALHVTHSHPAAQTLLAKPSPPAMSLMLTPLTSTMTSETSTAAMQLEYKPGDVALVAEVIINPNL